MKERLVTLGLAACALALFWLLLFPKPEGRQTVPRPLTSASGDEGYFAASGWLKATGVPTLEMHKRFDQTGGGTLSAAGSGNLLITTLPYKATLNSAEYTALENWIEKGNVLLIIAALDDTPLWSAISPNFVPEVQRLSGIEFTAVEAVRH